VLSIKRLPSIDRAILRFFIVYNLVVSNCYNS
jgi:hypothetical protein